METQSYQATIPTLEANLKNSPTALEIQAWITSYLSELLSIAPDEVDVTIPFGEYGLDSSAAVGLSGILEEKLEKKLDPTILYDYPTVKSLSRHLADDL